MNITYVVAEGGAEGRFVAQSRFEEKDALKTAGFRWDPQNRVWWTKFKEAAARLLDYCDESARAALAQHVAAVASSKATDATVDAPAPAGLAYLPYQRAGIAFGIGRKGTLLADEPGLGKTIQVLGIINASPVIRRTLVVCPASLRLNWRREAQKWLVRPTRVQAVVNGTDEVVISNDEEVLVVVGYEGLVKRLDLQVVRWDLVVVDEAHYIKNDEAQRSKAVDAACYLSMSKMFLTGTPILNRTKELWPLIVKLDERIPDPKYDRTKHFGTFWSFAKRYCGAHKKQAGRKQVWDLDGATNLAELQEKLRGSIMIRRLKADVLPELPPKRRQVVELDVKADKGEGRMADLVGELEEIEALEDLALETGDEFDGDGRRSQAMVKIGFEEMSTYRRQVGIKKVKPAAEYIATLREGGVDKVIVFAHHNEVLNGLEAALTQTLNTEMGEFIARIDGSMDGKKRQEAVDAFQNVSACKIILCSIMAAGVGLTLTASSTEVFVESDWVPGNITQAEDRAHRIGQKNMVNVHQLTVPDTLDSYMTALVVKKQDIADRALDTSTKVEVRAIPVRPKPTYNVAAEKRAMMLEVLRGLSILCDGAVKDDAMGFNSADTVFGKSLARREELSDKMFFAALKMCRKYRRQIPGELYAALWGGKEVA